MLSASAVPRAPLLSPSPALLLRSLCTGRHLRHRHGRARTLPQPRRGEQCPGPAPGRSSRAHPGLRRSLDPAPGAAAWGRLCSSSSPAAKAFQEVKAAGCSALGVQPERCRGSKCSFSGGRLELRGPKGHQPFLRTLAKDPQLGGGTRRSRGRARLALCAPMPGASILLCPEHPPKKQAAGTCPPPLSSCPSQ